MINIECNITLRCNRSCWACNRMCNTLLYTKHDDMSLQQIDDFLKEAKVIKINRLKLLGGEPLVHPLFKEIYLKLYQATKDGTILNLKVDYNHTIPFPIDLPHDNVRLMGKSFTRKQHLAMIHPLDAGFVTKAQPDCPALRRCGFSIDALGYLPCSPAIMLERMYKFGLYRQVLPTEPWGLDEFCPNCPFSMPIEFQKAHTYHLDQHPSEYDKPSPRYMELLNAMVRP